MKKYAVIVAAGSGLRMGSSVPKQFLLLHGKPVLWYTITAFLRTFDDIEVILVLPEKYIETGREISKTIVAPDRVRVVKGGETRFHSVKNGLAEINQPSIVFVHDGVRCLVTSDLIQRCYDVALEKGNAVPAVSSVDSLRVEKKDGNEIVDRDKIKIIQTPQTFRSDILKAAFQQQYQEIFTDEASVVENTGVKINLVEGDETNIKFTRPLDMIIAEKFLQDH
jgi:2-C-methyl-D-erythritol 4-phosphate cytidylyltransferase